MNKEEKSAAYAEWYAAHKAERAAYLKEWRAANRERRATYQKAWAAANGERIRATATERRHANVERNREIAKQWRERNPGSHGDPIARAAREKVKNEVRTGRFPPANTMVCDICQEALAAHWHHHNGYGPGHEIDVIAVCRECHGTEHRKEKHEVIHATE